MHSLPTSLSGKTKLYLDILPQPDDITCGPTCLHAVYRYYGDPIPLNQLILEIEQLKEGGTLNVYLACHALRRGYKSTIFTYNLQLFDPTWFIHDSREIAEKLRLQKKYKKNDLLLQVASKAYLDFLELGGKLRCEVLTPALIRRYLNRSIPLLTGLNATYLYNCPREIGKANRLFYDDVQGESVGHFVILAGYDREKRNVLVVDPLMPNPVSENQQYEVNIFRLICAIMLGIVTYDANLLIIEPRRRKK